MTTAAVSSFDSLDPATDETVGTYPIHGADHVGATVEAARTAAGWWAEIGFAERKHRLLQWSSEITRRAHELAELIHQETGKPHADAMLEIVLAIDHLSWAAKHARKILGSQRRSPGLLMINQAARVEYQPLGVVGVIGPWNYPAFTPMGSIAYALAAGNAAVFKPSEYTPAVGQWLADTLSPFVPEQPVLQLVTGSGETGAALCRSGVDKLAFTGSAATARSVMETCAKTLTPVLIEAGGKDAMLVDADADLNAAADAAVWGGMSNAGQTCIGVERVYAHAAVYDAFLSKVLDRARRIRPGSEPDADYGPMTMPSQAEVIRDHIADALTRGGRAVLGGTDAVGERYVQPTVLVDVPDGAQAATEETFGPTLTVSKVADMGEAVAKANSSRYGLGSTVFSRARGTELARKLRSGMTAVNSVISFAAIPTLPFGGVGDSGFGRIHGPDGLREFTRAKAIARQRFRAPLALTTFARTKKTETRLEQLITRVYGRK